jgi:hypothetical protein
VGLSYLNVMDFANGKFLSEQGFDGFVVIEAWSSGAVRSEQWAVGSGGA